MLHHLPVRLMVIKISGGDWTSALCKCLMMEGIALSAVLDATKSEVGKAMISEQNCCSYDNQLKRTYKCNSETLVQ